MSTSRSSDSLPATPVVLAAVLSVGLSGCVVATAPVVTQEQHSVDAASPTARVVLSVESTARPLTSSALTSNRSSVRRLLADKFFYVDGGGKVAPVDDTWVATFSTAKNGLIPARAGMVLSAEGVPSYWAGFTAKLDDKAYQVNDILMCPPAATDIKNCAVMEKFVTENWDMNDSGARITKEGMFHLTDFGKRGDRWRVITKAQDRMIADAFGRPKNR